MRAKRKACMTCAHFMDDGKCHRYPPITQVYEVTYNLIHGLVTKYPFVDRDGNTRLDFPKVDELMVCGEWKDRLSDELVHVMRYDELADMVLSERGE